MLVWDGLLIHITDYLKVHVSDEYSIRILHDLTEVPELTEGDYSNVTNKI